MNLKGCGLAALVALAACDRGAVTQDPPVSGGGPDAAPPEAAAADGAPPDSGTPRPPHLPAETVWRPCGGLGAAITALAHSPDGRWLAVAHGDGRVNLVRRSDGVIQARLQAGEATIDRMVFSADSEKLATLAAGMVRIFAVSSASTIRELPTGFGAGSSLQFAPAGTGLLLAAGEQRAGGETIKVWRIDDGAVVGSFVGPATVVFADQGRALLVDRGDGRLTTVSLSGRVVRRPALRPTPASLMLSPDGELAAGRLGDDDPSGANHRVGVYSALDGRLLLSSAPGHTVGPVFFLPGLHRLLVGRDGASVLLELPEGTLPASVAAAASAEAEDVSPDGQSVVRADDEGRLSALATKDWSPSAIVPAEFGIQEPPVSFAVTPDGRYLAAAVVAGRAFILALADGALHHVFSAEVGIKPAFSPDGTLFALGGDGRSVFRMSDGAALLDIPPPNSVDIPYPFPGLVFSADGQILASGERERVALYGLDGRPLGSRPSRAFAPGIAFSSDGKWMATTGPELWRAGTETRVWSTDIEAPLPIPQDASVDDTAAFSPDGSLLLVSHAFIGPPRATGSAQLLRISDGSVVRDFGDTLGRRPSFSPDGTWIAAGAEVVHLETGARRPLDGPLGVSIFLPDGRIAGASSHVVRLFCPSTL